MEIFKVQVHQSWTKVGLQYLIKYTFTTNICQQNEKKTNLVTESGEMTCFCSWFVFQLMSWLLRGLNHMFSEVKPAHDLGCIYGISCYSWLYIQSEPLTRIKLLHLPNYIQQAVDLRRDQSSFIFTSVDISESYLLTTLPRRAAKPKGIP